MNHRINGSIRDSSFILNPSSFVAPLLALLFAAHTFALDIPPKPTTWVTDHAGILSPEQQQALNEKLEALHKQTGAQFLVMTFPTLGGEDVTDYTNRVANQWKVKDDKALMLFVFPNDRKMWIQVGYGLEPVITDAYASRVYRETLVPAFRRGQYYEGIDQAITQLAQKVDPSFAPQSRSLPSSSASRRAAGSSQLGGRDIMMVLFILFIFFVVIAPMMRRRGGCGCGGCWWPMFFWPGGGGTTFGGGGGGGGGWSIGGSWGGGGSSFGGGGAGGGW